MNAAPVAGGALPEASAAAAQPADAGSAEAGARERRGDDRPPPAPPEAVLAQRFQRLLADEPVAAELPAGDAQPAAAEPALPPRGTLVPATSDQRHGGQHDEPPQPDAAPPLPSPMALFTRLAETEAPRAPEAPPPPPDWLQRIEALAVAGGDVGERRVRLTLADTLLPETEVEVGEMAGELQVQFFCRRESGREALSLQAPLLAQALADRLQREVRVSVGGLQRDGDERTHSLARPETAP